jgi:DNA-binding response OmpR family regulator
MQVLIVESTSDLAELWRRHLERQGALVTVCGSGMQACDLIAERDFDVIILDLILTEGSALAVADYAQYRRPDASVIFVTDTTFFSDGSIFSVIPNVRAFVQSQTPPEDLAAMVAHYGRAA